MRWLHVVLMVAAIGLTLGLLGVQLRQGQRQRASQKAALDRFMAEHDRYMADLARQGARQKADHVRRMADLARQEAYLARYLADVKVWQAKAKARPGQPLPLMPLPPITMPPSFTQPPVFFWWIPMILLLVLAPIAAAEQQRRQKLQHQEEEDRTPYAVEDLMENWEFKIIRCPIPLFEKPAFLENVLREEAHAGWQLVEKFDGTRVRLKRVAGRQPVVDLPAGYDPYRTAVTWQVKSYIPLRVFCILCLILVAVFIVAALFDPLSAPAFWALMAGAAGGAIVFGWLAVRQAAKYRRWANSAFRGASSGNVTTP
jgi:hypothetical protein